MSLNFGKGIHLNGAVDEGGGGGGDVTVNKDYTELSNKPSINGVTLIGNKTSADLGISTTGGGEDKYGIRGDYCSKYGIIDCPNGLMSSPVGTNSLVIAAGIRLLMPNKDNQTTLASQETYNIESANDFTLFYLDGSWFEANEVCWQVAEPNGTADATAWWNPEDNKWRFKSNDTGNVFREASGTPLADVYMQNGAVIRIEYAGYRLLNSQIFATQEYAAQKQDKTDSALTTTDKTVTGAINELKNLINFNSVSIASKQDSTDNALTTTNKTIVGAINEIKASGGSGEYTAPVTIYSIEDAPTLFSITTPSTTNSLDEHLITIQLPIKKDGHPYIFYINHFMRISTSQECKRRLTIYSCTQNATTTDFNTVATSRSYTSNFYIPAQKLIDNAGIFVFMYNPDEDYSGNENMTIRCIYSKDFITENNYGVDSYRVISLTLMAYQQLPIGSLETYSSGLVPPPPSNS